MKLLTNGDGVDVAIGGRGRLPSSFLTCQSIVAAGREDREHWGSRETG